VNALGLKGLSPQQVKILRTALLRIMDNLSGDDGDSYQDPRAHALGADD
jgi:hypothetical protein